MAIFEAALALVGVSDWQWPLAVIPVRVTLSLVRELVVREAIIGTFGPMPAVNVPPFFAAACPANREPEIRDNTACCGRIVGAERQSAGGYWVDDYLLRGIILPDPVCPYVGVGSRENLPTSYHAVASIKTK